MKGVPRGGRVRTVVQIFFATESVHLLSNILFVSSSVNQDQRHGFAVCSVSLVGLIAMTSALILGALSSRVGARRVEGTRD